MMAALKLYNSFSPVNILRTIRSIHTKETEAIITFFTVDIESGCETVGLFLGTTRRLLGSRGLLERSPLISFILSFPFGRRGIISLNGLSPIGSNAGYTF